MATQTRFVFLLHPKEWKQEKAATGRLTHLCLSNSELHMVRSTCDAHPAVQALLDDPANHCVLLYPGPTAHNLTQGELAPAALGARRLVVLLLDGTWPCARKMLNQSPRLAALPRVMFTPSAPSRWRIKQPPQPGCLSTLEAVHETLLALARAGLDQYPDPAQLLNVFQRMQDFQIKCAEDPNLPSYRRPRGPAGGTRPAYSRVQVGAEVSRRRRFLPPPSA
jgi:DTW domain-containing protein